LEPDVIFKKVAAILFQTIRGSTCLEAKTKELPSSSLFEFSEALATAQLLSTKLPDVIINVLLLGLGIARRTVPSKALINMLDHLCDIGLNILVPGSYIYI
jgi:hypothetical protein